MGSCRLPEVEGDKPGKKKFRRYPIGHFHIDIAEVRTGEGKLYLFVARTSKFAHAELHKKAGKMAAAQFLRNLVAVVPYAIRTVLTDNGIQFTNRKRDRCAFERIFGRVCRNDGRGDIEAEIIRRIGAQSRRHLRRRRGCAGRQFAVVAVKNVRETQDIAFCGLTACPTMRRGSQPRHSMIDLKYVLLPATAVP